MKVKILSIAEIKKLHPCAEGLAFARAHKDWWDKCERSDWLLWYLHHTNQISKRLAVAIAVACAERVLPIYEAKYAEDDRPAKAIAAAKLWLANPSEENISRAAKSAAAAAAYAADAAANAANAAYAADAAAYAANAAYAADAAAYAANATTATYGTTATYATYAANAAAYAANATTATYATYATYAANAIVDQKWQADKIRELCKAWEEK